MNYITMKEAAERGGGALVSLLGFAAGIAYLKREDVK